jgi:5-formyltetrahydrofolate cyclo-ligase
VVASAPWDNPWLSEVLAEKKRLRRLALERRRALEDREARSRQIWQYVLSTREFASAHTVVCYVALPDEVQTLFGLSEIQAANKRLAIPYCSGGDLLLARISDLNEISPGYRGIGEPDPTIRRMSERIVHPTEVDLVLVPGVAFDRRGGRLGYGKGYFDRFLRKLRPDAVRMGLAFDCQVVAHLPQCAYDVPVDVLVTESGVFYTCARSGDSDLAS